MNKLQTFCFIALILLMGTTSVCAETVTYTFPDVRKTTVSTNDTNKIILLTFSAKNSSAKPAYVRSELRIYATGYISVSVKDANKRITNIKFTGGGSGNAPKVKDKVASAGTYTSAGGTIEWNGVCQTVTFTNPESANYWGIKKLEITYGDVSAGSADAPCTVTEALQQPAGTVVYVKGVVAAAKRDTIKSGNFTYYHQRYDISADGTTSAVLKTREGKNVNYADFSGPYDIARGDEVSICGMLSLDATGAREIVSPTMTALKVNADSATITSAGWATFVSRRPVDFSASTDLQAYAVKYNAETDVISLTAVNAIPANTAVIVKGAEGVYPLSPATSKNTTVSNELKFFTTRTEVTTDHTIYILAQNSLGECGFHPVIVNTTVAPFKGYLQLSGTPAAKDFYTFNDAITGIRGVRFSAGTDHSRYNLAGQRVNITYKGVVITKGKKFLVK